LVSIDLVKSRKDGNRIYYKANTDSPIYSDLVPIVEKTVSIGSMAKNKEKASSDIDFIIILTAPLTWGFSHNYYFSITPHFLKLLYILIVILVI
jgi:hypothetical protein